MASHRRTSSLDEFCDELIAFRTEAKVSVPRIAEMSVRSESGIYKAWCKTELAPWKLVEDVIRAVCLACGYADGDEQRTVEYWRERHRAVKEEIEAGKDVVTSLLNELVEWQARQNSRTDRLEQALKTLCDEVTGLKRGQTAQPDATLHFGSRCAHEHPHDLPQHDVLAEVRQHIVRYEHEAQRLREESEQAELRARELSEHAREVQARADRLHRYLGALLPAAGVRPSLPGQAVRQE
ncbi:hypothetical protein ACIPSE_06730 [Streptomyces sp. NPDC090106]|uniref:hypothetical protein n=1 Tax=Streptomyces sp. NPDC090106 TaxID=3365946 RepID=UPI0037F6664F